MTRALHLGLEWAVDTTVQRLTASDTAITLQVPLLAGESVTTPDVRTENGNAVVSMPPGTPVVQWHSTLKIAPQIELKAPDSVPWTEVWQLDPGPMWHVEPRGIPEVYQAAEQSPGRMRQWQPWPGEVVTLAVTRPEGISGQTLTIDSSRLEMNPGLRASDVTVNPRGAQQSRRSEEFRPSGAGRIAIAHDQRGYATDSPGPADRHHSNRAGAPDDCNRMA